MGFLQNQNGTLVFSQPEIVQWESTPQQLSAVNNAIIVLGVLTFALQLCLVLLFMLRCWRLDSAIQEALKDPDAGNKLTAPSFFHKDMYEGYTYKPCDEDAASSPAPSEACEQDRAVINFLFGSSIPWDLVQH